MAAVYRRGIRRQYEIAEVLAEEFNISVNRATISRDIKALRRQWRETSEQDFKLAFAEALDEIEGLKREYWETWLASLEESKTRTLQMKANRQGQPTPAAETIRTEEGRGDLRALAGVQWCIDRRIKLLGLDEAVKVDVMSGGKPLFDLAEWQRVREERRQQVAEMEDTASDGNSDKQG